MIPNTTFYFFDQKEDLYKQPANPPPGPGLAKRIFSASKTMLNTILNLDGSNIKKALFCTTVSLTSIGMSAFSEWALNYFSQPEKPQETFLSSATLAVPLALSAATLLWSQKSILKEELNQLPKFSTILSLREHASCFFSQMVESNLIASLLGSLVDKVRKEYRDIFNLWEKISGFKNDQDMKSYLKNIFQRGVCFGWVMSLVEQLEKENQLHGDQLIAKTPIEAIMKKQLFHIIYNDLRNVLFSTFPSIDMGIHPDCLFTLKNGKTIRTQSLVDALQKLHRLIYFGRGVFRVNTNTGWAISVTAGPLEIKQDFLNNLHKKSFLSICESDPLNPKKSFRNHLSSEIRSNLKGDFMQRMEMTEMFIESESERFPKDTVVAGPIYLELKGDFSHALYFRISNGVYHLFDPNLAFYELPTFDLFFEKLYTLVKDAYGADTNISFEQIAIRPARDVNG